MKYYNHPNPIINRFTQTIMFGILILISLAIPLLFLLGILLSSSGVSLIGVMLFILAMPLVMQLSASPSITLDETGITIHPLFWRDEFIAWEQILVMKPYTLLPTAGQEVERRALQGRLKYQEAEGQMLIINQLSPQYRVAGFFAGERFQPIIALTNRTHENYAELIEQIRLSCPRLVQSEEIQPATDESLS